jgi:hypothetical protein
MPAPASHADEIQHVIVCDNGTGVRLATHLAVDIKLL